MEKKSHSMPIKIGIRRFDCNADGNGFHSQFLRAFSLSHQISYQLLLIRYSKCDIYINKFVECKTNAAHNFKFNQKVYVNAIHICRQFVKIMELEISLEFFGSLLLLFIVRESDWLYHSKDSS